MASRKSPASALDFFPTPPWATRALCEEILGGPAYGLKVRTAWEPCCGAGHMAEPLKEYFGAVFSTDVRDWGYGDRRDLDFIFATAADAPFAIDWVITNPPFTLAEEIFERAWTIAHAGVAMLLRLQWLEGGERHRSIFDTDRRPTWFCPFAERVPMIEGVWDPEASSATAYAWFVWQRRTVAPKWTRIVHIAPGMAERHTRLSDMSLATPGEAERRRQAKAALRAEAP
jgi:hypothetical protein